MRLLISFLVVMLAGSVVGLYFSIPFLGPRAAPYSNAEVRVMATLFFPTPLVTGLFTVLIWALESSLARLIIRRMGGGRSGPSLTLIMREFSLAYVPVLAFLIVAIPLAWSSVPNKTVVTVEEYMDLVREIASSPTYVSGMMGLVAVSLAHYLVCAVVMRFRLGLSWRAVSVTIPSLLLMEAMLAWCVNSFLGVNSIGS